MNRLGKAWVLWAIAALAYLALIIWSAINLPDPVPSHFDGSGKIDDWSSKGSMLVFWVLFGVGMLGGIPAICQLATRGNARYLNLPHKDYWLAPERRHQFRRDFLADILVMTALTGALLVALMAVSGWVAVAGRDGAPGWWFSALIGGYLVAMSAWMIGVLRRYRP